MTVTYIAGGVLCIHLLIAYLRLYAGGFTDSNTARAQAHATLAAVYALILIFGVIRNG